MSEKPNVPREGDRVSISGYSYGGRYSGLNGTVRGDTTQVIRGYWTHVAVEVDGRTNANSARGLFYFPYTDLIPLDEACNKLNDKTKGNDNMHKNNMHKMENYYCVASIQLHDPHTDKGSVTTEFASYVPVTEGDTCVVMTANHGMSLGKVMAVKEESDKDVFREVVAVVDMTDYNIRTGQREKLAELKALMNERAKNLQDIALYETLAKADPGMLQLLTEFKNLPIT